MCVEFTTLTDWFYHLGYSHYLCGAQCMYSIYHLVYWCNFITLTIFTHFCGAPCLLSSYLRYSHFLHITCVAFTSLYRLDLASQIFTLFQWCSMCVSFIAWWLHLGYSHCFCDPYVHIAITLLCCLTITRRKFTLFLHYSICISFTFFVLLDNYIHNNRTLSFVLHVCIIYYHVAGWLSHLGYSHFYPVPCV